MKTHSKIAISITIIILLAISSIVLYSVYKFNYAKDLHLEITKGSYKDFKIGEAKESIVNKIRNAKVEEDGAYREIELSSSGDGEINGKYTAKYKAGEFHSVQSSYFMKHSSWVIYLCSEQCDWRKNANWIAFNFNEEKLESIIRYKRNRWEGP